MEETELIRIRIGVGDDVSRRKTDLNTIENDSRRSVDLVDPFTEPVAVVNDVELEVGPHIVRVVPLIHALTIDLALYGEGCTIGVANIENRNHSRLALPVDAFELAVNPDLSDTSNGRQDIVR